jgi:ferredoxin--NADP+ reductase
MTEGARTGPARVAVVGSGPAAFYTAEALLKAAMPCEVDMFERLPTPFGLVRYGVAPDHPKLKSVVAVFERIATLPGFRFFGNVEVGRDVTIELLRRAYDAVVMATGAGAEQRLNIPGIDLPGCHTATEFVGWYNGHPDHAGRSFDLSGRHAIVVGQGNVAVDVCRILARPVAELCRTDMADHALAALAESHVAQIQLIGRRGPAQAKFTNRELRELGELPDVAAHADLGDLELNAESRTELEDKANDVPRRNLEVLQDFARRQGDAPKSIRVRFLLTPVRVEGDGRVERLVLRRNRLEGPPFAQRAVPTDEELTLPCDLLVSSIGYRGVPLPGVPFDARTATIPHRGGRVLRADGEVVPRLYCVGWIKRGATGVIGTNRACAVETVESMFADREGWRRAVHREPAGLLAAPDAARVRTVSWQDWLRLDGIEKAHGRTGDRPRVKLTHVDVMLAALAAP